MDTLSEVLRAVRLTGAIFFDVHASEPWVAETPEGKTVVAAMFPGSEHLISYHVITHGSCWACVEGEQPIRLSAGDVIVLPHGHTHVLSSTPGLRRRPDMSMYRYPADGRLPVSISVGGSRGDDVRFVCGFLGCDSRPYNPLLNALPRVIRVSDPEGGVLGTYVQFALAESKAPRLGGQGVLGRLSELMFIDVVRRYLESLPADRTDWLAGLRDPFVGRALSALHRNPARGLDHRVSGTARRIVALGAGGALLPVRRPAAHAVPDELAHPTGRQPVAQRRRQRGGDRQPCRLRFRSGLQPRIQESGGHATEPVAC